jgi:two-component system nitrogen regulation response regulator NtrX
MKQRESGMKNNKPAILIVDDEEKFRTHLGRLLEMEGYDVHLAKEGKEALDIIQTHELDLVLLDMKMPGMDGMTVLKRSVNVKPYIPIIMVTAYGEIELAVKAIKLGAYDFIEKPSDLQRMLITVKNALEKSLVDQEKTRLIQSIRRQAPMIGSSRNMKEVYELIEKTAPTPLPVLILGEHGTGKELVATAIHHLSHRVSRNFVKVNCAAIHHELIKSELFGHKKGSFSGANEDRIGKFQRADKGTLFMDEIGDMSLDIQAKVLRALEQGEMERIGDPTPITVDVRIVAATNKDLKKEIDAGRFREDLYYRLDGVIITVPPLRERKEDIPELAVFFLQRYCEGNNIRMKVLSPSASSALMQYSWKGNVRELKHFMEKLIVFTPSNTITESDVQSLQEAEPSVGWRADETLTGFKQKSEKEFLLGKLIENDWNIAKTARALKMERPNLYRKIKKYDLKR